MGHFSLLTRRFLGRLRAVRALVVNYRLSQVILVLESSQEDEASV